MPEKHSSPDWFARGAAAVGIVLSILGFGLAYTNYRWQKEIYQENTAERILVRVGISRPVNDPEPFSLNPNGEMKIEVVNIGLRSLYIKKVEIRIENSIFTFYQHDDPKATSEPMKLLEPSEAANYTLSWNFSEHSLMEWPGTDSKKEDVQVQVETTKKTFSFQHQTVNSIYMYWTVPRSLRKH
jgi:hypothetical protein